MNIKKQALTQAFVAIGFLVLLGIVIVPSLLLTPVIAPATESDILPVSPATLLADLPMRFVENRGQAGADAIFHVQAAGHTILFDPDRVVFRRSDSNARNDVTLRFVNARQGTVVSGVDKLSGVAHFYRGSNPEDWRTNVETFGGILYQNLYPGIDMGYAADGGALKSEFYLSPHADVRDIRLEYENVLSRSIRDDGALVVRTALGDLIENAPIAFQETDGVRTGVSARFVLHPDSTIGFELGSYDPDKQVVIDPELVFLNTFSSVGGGVFASSVALDASGNLILAGGANRFFSTTDVIEGSNHVGGLAADGLLMKLDAVTGDVLFSALFGGDRSDYFNDVEIDAAGTLYLTGRTASDDFPVLNPAQATRAGMDDAFISIISSDGVLTYSSYLGGSQLDWGESVTIDGSGNIFLVGRTVSSDFPIVGGVQQQISGGNSSSTDLFITRLAAAGTIDYSTYLGGTEDDRACGIILDSSGELTIAGISMSDDYPMANAYQETYAGGGFGQGDIIVSRLNAAGDALVYSTYYGGTAADWCTGVAAGTAGEAFIAGGTSSVDFTVIGGTSQAEADSADGVVLMFGTDGQPVYAVRTNRSGSESFDAIVVDGDNTALPIGGFDDSVQIYSKPLTGDLDSLFAFAAPGHRVNGAYLLGGRLGFGGTYFASAPNVSRAGKTGNEIFGSLNELSLSESEASGGTVSLSQAAGALLAVMMESDFEGTVMKVGQHVKWTLSVTNIGTETATNVEMRALPDPELTPFLVTDLSFPVGDLAPGETKTRRMFTYLEQNTKSSQFNLMAASADNAALVETSLGYPSTSETTEVKTISDLLGRSGKNGTSALDSIDIYIDSLRVANDLAGQSVSALTNVELSQVVPELTIVDGNAADNSNPLVSIPLDLLIADTDSTRRLSKQTIVILGEVEPDSLSMLVKLDARFESTDIERTEFFFANSTDAPIDVVLLTDASGKTSADTIVDDLQVNASSAYVSVVPAVHTLELRSADGSTLLNAFEFDLSASAGDAMTAIVGGEGASVTVEMVSGNGEFTVPTVVTATDDVEELPTEFRFLENYPNPFGASTTIRYEIGESASVSVIVYDVVGRRVRTLLDADQPAGRYTVQWDGRNDANAPVGAGVYVVRLETESGVQTRAVTLLR